MKLHLTWPVSITAAALVLAGCSSSDSGSAEESSASS
jgi:iron uptake system component EfeO